MCRGSDATRLFEQFHVMTDKHRKALKKFEVHEYTRSDSPGGVEDTPPPRNERSAFHEDLKAMLRRHFPDLYDGHKCTYQHAACLGATFAAYAVGWYGWWHGEVYTGVFLLGLCAWLIMANLAHDGSHHAVSRRPWVNEISLLTSSPLLYSYGSWYQQHCASHHLETNDPDLDVDVQHHPFARWERSMWKDHNLTGVINLLWHFTAFLVSTANMSLTHPWKFVFVPWVRRHLGLELPAFFGTDNVEWASKQKKAKKHAPHELAFFEPPCGTAKQVCKRQRQWPRMDIVEHDKEYLVTADTPGVPKDQLKVELTKDGITLSFDHDETKEEKAEDGKVIRRERSHRSFRRTIGLPAGVIDRDGIAAKVEDGVLRLTIPKAPESVPKTITVE